MLLLIDLMNGVVGSGGAPHHPEDVVANSARLAKTLRDNGGFVVLVRVDHAPDGSLAPAPITDTTGAAPAELPSDWNEVVPELCGSGDAVVTKFGWDAFHGTELDMMLRRKRVETILLGGMITNLGVESAARSAFDLGYEQIFVEDAMTGFDPTTHRHTTESLFPMIGRVRRTEELLKAFA
ncbi:nicotinamidase-related amidase [Actinopolyspora lacussalsi]|nr:nicotinamidase-related amidase [Actinopolyspora lacussalsi]